MPIGKNKTGIMAAITLAADPSKTPDIKRERASRTLPRGTIGSVRAGLGGIQEIETSLILSWGPQDRLELELTTVNSESVPSSLQGLVDSISESGQKIPILLRPSRERDGFFEVVYGQRRIGACAHLGIPVKALVRTLDDADALLAKGLENSSRADLSYYERARFAHAILNQGYGRAETCQALAVSKNTLSQLERIVRLVPQAVGDAIGAAPRAGRPKWMNVAAAFEKEHLTEAQALDAVARCSDNANSDERLEAVLKDVKERSTAKHTTTERSPVPGVTIRSGKATLSVSVKHAGVGPDFAAWLDQNLDGLLKDSLERFRIENPEGRA